MEVGDHVLIIGLDTCGKVVSVRHDDRGEALITVELDDCTYTPDGMFLARDFELRRL